MNIREANARIQAGDGFWDDNPFGDGISHLILEFRERDGMVEARTDSDWYQSSVVHWRTADGDYIQVIFTEDECGAA